MTKENFKKGMLLLEGSFPKFIEKRSKDLTRDIYWSKLKDMPDKIFEFAVEKAIESLNDFPTIHQVKEFSQLDTAEADALDAWAEVVEQVGGVGFYGTPKFSNPMTDQVVKSIGGWPLMCATETSKMGIQREAFIKAFRAFRRREAEIAPLLTGAVHPQISGMVRRIGAGKPKMLTSKEKGIEW